MMVACTGEGYGSFGGSSRARCLLRAVMAAALISSPAAAIFKLMLTKC